MQHDSKLPVYQTVPATQATLEVTGANAALVLEHLYDGVYFVDRNLVIQYWNPAAERISGHSGAEVLGKTCSDGILDHCDFDGRRLCQEGCPLSHAIDSGESNSQRVFLHHRDGRRVCVDVHVTPIPGPDGQPLGAVEVFRDATDLLALESAYAEMSVIAQKDPLTELPNRRSLDRHLDGQISLWMKGGRPFSVVMLDVDRFKLINDTWGHPQGDEVLRQLASSLRWACRDADFVARYGGEEFVLVLPGCPETQAVALAERVRGQLSQVNLPRPGPSEVTASFGVAEIRRGERWSDLVARADAALYRAKSGGRDRVEAASTQPELLACAS